MTKRGVGQAKRQIYYLLSSDIYFHEDGRQSLMPMAKIKPGKKRKRKHNRRA